MAEGACFINGEKFFNPVLTMGTQVSCLLVISHFFQILLKPFGQPTPVAQILAGFVLGPSCLSHIGKVKNFFFHNFAVDYYETMALYARIIIMFLMGLETDFPYLRRNLRVAGIIACGSCLTCTVFAAAVTSFIYQETGAIGSHLMMALSLSIILSNTASPFVARLAHDLKFANSDIGRLAISSSLISDVYAVFLLTIISRFKQKYDASVWAKGFLCIIIVAVSILFNIHAVNWLNRRNRDQKYLKNTEIFVLLAIVFVAATAIETMGFSSIIGCFFLGSMFPREGKAARTLLIKLSYSVHNFILPIYFGYTGFKADVTLINSFHNFAIVAIIILLSIGGKVTGTLAVCSHLKIPLNEGVIIAFLMNLKGHVDLLALTIGVENNVMSTQIFYTLMMAAVVINSLIWGPVIAYVVRRESDILGYKHTSFEFQSLESELKLLACVHGPRPVATMIGLIATCKGLPNVAITPYLTHLIELPEKTKTNLLYHQKEEDELSDDDNYGGNDVVEINESVDIFASETGVMIHQVKAVSPFASMYADVCEFAEEIRASIIILPFHKHQRIDGKLESGKEGIRATNQKVLRHANCTVAILVDRGLTAGTSYTNGSESLQHVATLFFGGPDDREALGLSKRLGMHQQINLTIIRFRHTSERSQTMDVNVDREEDNVSMEIPNHESENDADSVILTDFYNRYVTTGQVGYVEKHVENGAETASALRDMADMYSMFIVGKGRRGSHSVLTTGMSDWEECPELGKVGDLLASSDFDLSGSVLVIQQHRPSKNQENE